MMIQSNRNRDKPLSSRNAVLLLFLSLAILRTLSTAQQLNDDIRSFFQSALLRQQQQQQSTSNPNDTSHDDQQIHFLKSCLEGNPQSIYLAANQIMNKDTPLLGRQNVLFAMELYHYAADHTHSPHVPAQAKLGSIYAEGGTSKATSLIARSTSKALEYFTMAAELGHHQSLYNAGHLLAEGVTDVDVLRIRKGEAVKEDFVVRDIIGAMQYLQGAARFHELYSESEGGDRDHDHDNGSNAIKVDNKITILAQQALSTVCQHAVDAHLHNQLSIQQVADVFLFGSAQSALPEEAELLWHQAITSLLQFQDRFVSSQGSIRDVPSMTSAYQSLKRLVDEYGDSGDGTSSTLSELQLYFTLAYLNDMLSALVDVEEGTYLKDAGIYAEKFAISTLCAMRFKVKNDNGEQQQSCYNNACEKAIEFYLRADDLQGAERVKRHLTELF